MGNPSVEKTLKKREQKRFQEIDDLVVNLKCMDTVDLAVRMVEASQDVELVATSSGNLKGTYVKKLKMAAKVVEVITEELHKRTKSAAAMRLPAIPSTSELATPRVIAQAKEIAALRSEVAKLKKELATEKVKNSWASESESAAPLSKRTQRTEEPNASMEETLLKKMESLIDRKLEAAGLSPNVKDATRRAAPPRATTRKEETATKTRRVNVNVERKEEARKQSKKTAKEGGRMVTETDTEAEGGWAKVVGRKAKRSPPPGLSPRLCPRVASSSRVSNSCKV